LVIQLPLRLLSDHPQGGSPLESSSGKLGFHRERSAQPCCCANLRSTIVSTSMRPIQDACCRHSEICDYSIKTQNPVSTQARLLENMEGYPHTSPQRQVVYQERKSRLHTFFNAIHGRRCLHSMDLRRRFSPQGIL